MFLQRKPTKSLLYLALLSTTVALAAGMARAAAPAGGQRAEITLNVPLDAIVWVNGARMRSTGLTRTFVTPPLAPGGKYGYDLRITWVEGARAREIERHVSFRPGDRLVFNFAQPNWTETAQDLYLDPAAPAPWGTNYYQDPLNSPNYPPVLFPGWVWRPR
jgi:uncharacterized protein (TIGR03000 family)